MTKKALNQNGKYVKDLIDAVEPDFIFNNKPIFRFNVINNNENNANQDKSNELLKLKDQILD